MTLTSALSVADLSNQAVPEDKQAQFRHTYTVLIAFLTVILPPVITQSVNDVPSTAQETALGTSESLYVLRSTATFHAIWFKCLLLAYLLQGWGSRGSASFEPTLQIHRIPSGCMLIAITASLRRT